MSSPTDPALRLALVQAASALDPAANRDAVATLVAEHAGDADLVVFPEAFARDFGEAGSDVSPYAEPLDGPFATTLAEAAAAHHTTLLAGMFEQGPDPERPFNTLVMRGDATASYRKVHLYDSFGYRESDRLSAGPLEPVVVDLHGWRVGLMTCYDLRFPELARALVERGAELIVLPAAWVAGPRKVAHWRTLVSARAIENTVYVAAVGQPAGRYCGHSLVVDPFGEVLAEAGPGSPEQPEVVRVVIEHTVLAEARRVNPSLLNRRM
ncbi:carbon-nitrogen hydrolase family protein [Nocardioides nitrophenolicus]|uniref:carbon-nitrogen hydrolase family protein n=1 Tax=Nocardioides nitrophenolicus TaxID=60489 RepID=UPI00195C79D6|nr:carbon-nitrogen hydrolase family protein [Nocardioides nitrophenolicus]MBM7517915.1 putative amidohydrolase [Nocardioides nitrophenolicus]